jgi:hypothetical protein
MTNWSNQLRASYGRTKLHFDEVRDPYLWSQIFRSRLPNEPFLLNTRILENLSRTNTPGNYFSLPEEKLFSDCYSGLRSCGVAGDLGAVGQVIISPFSPVGADTHLFPQARANNTIQFAEILSRSAGTQTHRLGIDLRRTQLNSSLYRNYRPLIVFSGAPEIAQVSSKELIQNISRLGSTLGFFTGTDLAAVGIPTGIFQSLAFATFDSALARHQKCAVTVTVCNGLEPPDSTLGLRFWQYNLFIMVIIEHGLG